MRTLLKRVSKKADVLLTRLSEQQKGSVKTYLERPTTSVDDVKRVLHFGKESERKQTLGPETRLDLRQQLLVFLAAGGSVADAATYRQQYQGARREHLADLQPVASATGHMELVPLLGGLRVPPENMHLSQPQVNQIREVFDAVMNAVVYNSTAVPLDFISRVRQERTANPGVPIADVFNRYAVSDATLRGAAGGADCVGMASKVKAELAVRGIGSHIIGATSGNFLNQLPSHTRDRVGWQGAKDYAIYSHASVVVPYLDPASRQPRAIHIETGMGPNPQYFRQFETLVAGHTALSERYDTQHAVDPTDLAKKHIKCKWRMWLSPDVDQQRKVFVDLIEGSIWLSGAPADDVNAFNRLRRPGLVEGEGVKFNFQQALANPDREVTINISEGEVQRMSSREATELFFQVVRQRFNLPESFVQQMLFLAQNLNEFRQHVLLQPVNIIAEMWPLRERALAAQRAAEEAREAADVRGRTEVDWTAGVNGLRQALTELHQGHGDVARARYEAAIAAFQRVR